MASMHGTPRCTALAARKRHTAGRSGFWNGSVCVVHRPPQRLVLANGSAKQLCAQLSRLMAYHHGASSGSPRTNRQRRSGDSRASSSSTLWPRNSACIRKASRSAVRTVAPPRAGDTAAASKPSPGPSVLSARAWPRSRESRRDGDHGGVARNCLTRCENVLADDAVQYLTTNYIHSGAVGDWSSNFVALDFGKPELVGVEVNQAENPAEGTREGQGPL